jgi:hypothetical protein
LETLKTNYPGKSYNPEDYHFGKISPPREDGNEKKAEKDKVLRIKEKINNGPAEVRRKESNENNMKNKGHKKKYSLDNAVE